MLAGLPGGAAPSAPASKYTGGFLAALSPGAEPTLALAYEAKGGLSDVKATATAAGQPFRTTYWLACESRTANPLRPHIHHMHNASLHTFLDV
jgi:hypothetical protein